MTKNKGVSAKKYIILSNDELSNADESFYISKEILKQLYS